MAQVSTNEIKAGMKLEIEGQPYVVVSNDYVKPGKGQAFNRIRIKHLKTGRVVEKTWKSGDKLDEADVEEMAMRMLYKEGDSIVFMNEITFDQYSIQLEAIGENAQWLLEDRLYDIIFHKGEPLTVMPPTFMEMTVAETSPGVRGDTASGRVMKPAVTESGAKIQIPIFIEQGEKIKVDTRTAEYVSRSQE
jgi:elongation factor P